MPKLQCDFCNLTEIKWSYPADSFIILAVSPNGKALPWSSEGAWAACQICHEMIETGQGEALLDRTIATYPEPLKSDEVREAMREMVRALHMGFCASRTGPATPYKESV